MKKQTLLTTLVCVLLIGGALTVFSPQVTQATPQPIMGGLEIPFLKALSRERVPVAIYLVNGIKLQGQVEDFDGRVILLKNSVSQLIYINAVSTVVPARNVSATEAETD